MQGKRSKLAIVLQIGAGVALLLAIIACGGSSTDSSSSSTGSNEPESDGTMDLAITPLNLHMTAPEGTSVMELLGSQMVSGPGLVVTVKAATATDPADIEAAHHEAELFTPTNMHDETLPDGYVVTYQNSGGMGTNYFVTVRREIGGTAYMCSSTSLDEEHSTAAVNACKSLHR